jgi:hypothetical protein
VEGVADLAAHGVGGGEVDEVAGLPLGTRDEAIAKPLGGLMHQVRSEPANKAGEGT